MKSLRLILLAALLFCSNSVAMAANGFATNRLRMMAAYLTDIPFSQLGAGEHTGYNYMGHPLVVRVGRTGEVEHIGYKLFGAESRYTTSPVFDFVERYTLELEMMDESVRDMRMGIDHFMFEQGSLAMLHNLDIADSLSVSMLEMKRYRVAWYRGGVSIVSMVFNMDYQVLSSSNAIELEERYLRIVGDRDTLPAPFTPVIVSDTTDRYAIVDNGTWLSESIRAMHYYERDKNGVWIPVIDEGKVRWSAFNMTLSPVSLGDFVLKCRLDMYGYRDSTFTVSLYRWVSETMQEGCQMYFGVKSMSSKVIHGTIFCPNPAAGYCHMVSIDIPISAIASKEGTVKGTMFAYIPLHNIVDDFFDLNYMPIKTELK